MLGVDENEDFDYYIGLTHSDNLSEIKNKRDFITVGEKRTYFSCYSANSGGKGYQTYGPQQSGIRYWGDRDSKPMGKTLIIDANLLEGVLTLSEK